MAKFPAHASRTTLRIYGGSPRKLVRAQKTRIAQDANSIGFRAHGSHLRTRLRSSGRFEQLRQGVSRKSV
jgi:hypothetical protein